LPPGWITDSNDEKTEMVDVAKMFENFNLAILASDANFRVIYQNGNSGQDGNTIDQGLIAFAEVFKDKIKPEIKVIELNARLNDKIFSDTVLSLFDEMMPKVP